MYFTDDSKFSVVLSSISSARQSGFEALHLNRWEDGKFTTFLKTPFKLDPAIRYSVNLHEISFDCAISNLSTEDDVKYFLSETGYWSEFSLRRDGHFSTVPSVLNEIGNAIPRELRPHLKLAHNVNTNRVEIRLTEGTEFSLSENLATILAGNCL